MKQIATFFIIKMNIFPLYKFFHATKKMNKLAIKMHVLLFLNT